MNRHPGQQFALGFAQAFPYPADHDFEGRRCLSLAQRAGDRLAGADHRRKQPQQCRAPARARQQSPEFGLLKPGRAVGIATLYLMCNFTRAEKDSLMKGLVQYGIDLWGIVRGCNASRGWQAHGGHGTGRKWPMIFSGIMLGDSAMAAPTATYPALRIGEDMQTSRGFCWATGDTNYVYTGHQGLWNGQPVNTSPGWGPYEDTPPSQWYCCEPGYTAPLGEAYRRCCTSHAWIAEALSARLMKVAGLWNHPDFFGYCDRWMTQTHSDSAEIVAIKAARGWDFSPDWERQGASWDAVTNDMWKTYRNSSAVKSPGLFHAENNQRILIDGTMQARRGLTIKFSVAHGSMVSLVTSLVTGETKLVFLK